MKHIPYCTSSLHSVGVKKGVKAELKGVYSFKAAVPRRSLCSRREFPVRLEPLHEIGQLGREVSRHLCIICIRLLLLPLIWFMILTVLW